MTRRLLIDASVWLSLATVGKTHLLQQFDGTVVVPEAVAAEITSDPAANRLADARDDGWVASVSAVDSLAEEQVARAARLLGESHESDLLGDIALLALALQDDDTERVVVTDDQPLRRAGRARSIPVSSSIGVLVVAVERGALDAAGAVETLTAMDSVGARFSASLLRRAERLIEDADGEIESS